MLHDEEDIESIMIIILIQKLQTQNNIANCRTELENVVKY